jgi:allophanate hydrolase
MPAPVDLGVTALRAGYGSAKFTPVDVVTEVLARIGRRGDDHVWISRVSDDDLLRAASVVDTELPLGGIPFAVKDNIDVLGLPTTAACPDFAYWPERSADVVRRLLDAGALLVGKTNLDQFATGLNGTRSPYGACESVFGGGLISGGSSSGSAVAVAAGLVSFSLGTDTAGSGRVPAALNGIVGVKPTRGRLSTAGVVPACRSLDCVSVFAGSVADAVLVTDLLADAPPGPALPTTRLGVPDRDLDFAGDEPFRRAFLSTVDSVTSPGVPVDVSPLLEAGRLLYDGALVAERLADLAPFLASHPDSVLSVTRTVIESGAKYDAADLFRDLHRLAELKRQTDDLFERIDVLLLPTIPTTFTIGELLADPFVPNSTLGRFTQFANPLDLAVIAIPMGSTVDGRPFGVSLIGPANSDATLAALAAHLMSGRVPAPSKGDATAHLIGSAEGGPLLTIAVVGKHLRGEPRNHELTERGGEFLGTHQTAAEYRLYGLAGGVPGLLRTAHGGAAIEVELWALPVETVGSFLAGVGAPLSLGRIRLADGSEPVGFLCEAYATAGAQDITRHGGWRAYQGTREE